MNMSEQLKDACWWAGHREEGFPRCVISHLPLQRERRNKWKRSRRGAKIGHKCISLKVLPALWVGSFCLQIADDCISTYSAWCTCFLRTSLVDIKLCKWSEKENPFCTKGNNTSVQHHAELCLPVGFPLQGGWRDSIWGLSASLTIIVPLCVAVWVCVQVHASQCQHIWARACVVVMQNRSNPSHPPTQHPLLCATMLNIYLTCMWRSSYPQAGQRSSLHLYLLKRCRRDVHARWL